MYYMVITDTNNVSERVWQATSEATVKNVSLRSAKSQTQTVGQGNEPICQRDQERYSTMNCLETINIKEESTQMRIVHKGER